MILNAFPITHADIPEPQEKTIGWLSLIFKDLNFCSKAGFSKKHFESGSIHSFQGRFILFVMDPLRRFFLGSSSMPSNLPLLLASKI